MRRNPAVVLAIVDRDNPYQYVQIFGRVARPENRHTVLITPERITANLR